MWRLGNNSKLVYESGLHPDWKKIIDMALVVCPIDFSLVDGVRSPERQWQLFRIGRSHNPDLGSLIDPKAWYKTGNTVTNCDGMEKKSNHQVQSDGYGHAVDLAAYIPGRPNLAYDKVHLTAIIGSFLTCGNVLYHERKIGYILRSGADWDRDTEWLEPGTFHDLPHLELIRP